MDLLFYSGTDLNIIESEMEHFSNAVSRIKQKTSFNHLQVLRQTIYNLRKKVDNVLDFGGEAYNEFEMLPIHIQENDNAAIARLYTCKVMLPYYFGEYRSAIELLEKIKKYQQQITGSIALTLYHFINALSKLAVYSSLDKHQKREFLKEINTSIKKYKIWAKNCPENFVNKLYLIEAEKFRVFGHDLKAMEYYKKSIDSARENGIIHEEALANELAAKFYIERKMSEVAKPYLRNSHYCYMKWGAPNLVEMLERKYQGILALDGATDMNAAITTSTINTADTLDMASILKATQAISSEIVLEKLLEKLVGIVLESSGAQKVFFIMKKGSDLIIEAAGSIEDGKIAIMQAVPVQQSAEIPVSIINYVSRTGKSVVLDNAATSDKFIADAYIAATKPKSVLCIPIINKGGIIGFLYIENNSLSGAFTTERIKILSILSSQLAISIENANLYSHLDELVQERTSKLSEALEDLKNTQNQLVESEKMAALGQLISSIAHEINTPLGAINASITNITDYMQQTLDKLPLLFSRLSLEQQNLFNALLQRSLQNASLLSSQEVRSLKKNLQTILEQHSIKNSEILSDLLVDMKVFDNIETFLPLLKSIENVFIIKSAYYISALKKDSKNISLATERASKIVFALKNYARGGNLGDMASGEMTRTDITTGIETVLTIYYSQMKHNIEIIRNYQAVPQVLCFSDELDQVWTNIIHNALYAMEYKGTLTIDVSQEDEHVSVEITDSGKGIPEEIKEKIFSPFFTTKPHGEGTGLGLDIVRKIVSKHRGSVSVESMPGRTTFKVKLPINVEVVEQV